MNKHTRKEHFKPKPCCCNIIAKQSQPILSIKNIPASTQNNCKALTSLWGDVNMTFKKPK